jgi:2-polyprenyl-6-hydroxyphenyl methylase/3-demethylubiquinone-9 3-methyltransferase
VESGDRFEFGRNWRHFLEHLDDSRIAAASESLLEMLGRDDLEGETFLDIGSGSGLMSLAAYRSGATVTSFDFDPDSVGCTRALRERFAGDSGRWTVEQGDVLDEEYMKRVGTASIVYSWGVLHHTGAMWRAIDKAARAVAPGGQLFIALYNDEGPASRRWIVVKRLYNRLPRMLRWAVLVPCLVRLWGSTIMRDSLRGHPLHAWRNYSQNGRGMSPWHDLVDWVGGWPFEVAKPSAVVAYLSERGFRQERDRLDPGLGCNEFVFRRVR